MITSPAYPTPARGIHWLAEALDDAAVAYDGWTVEFGPLSTKPGRPYRCRLYLTGSITKGYAAVVTDTEGEMVASGTGDRAAVIALCQTVLDPERSER